MPTISKNWETGGGSVTITYSGVSSGAVTVRSTENNGADRTMDIVIKTSNNSGIQKVITLTQIGKREQFNVTEGAFSVSEGLFLTIK